VHLRVHTRDNLLRKTIVDVAGAGCPLCESLLETARYMMLHCPPMARFWATVGVVVPSSAHMSDLHLILAPRAITSDTASSFILLC
jgi:hypothetical protein